MPIYEYQCKDCGEEFERLVANSAEKAPCDCGSENVKRMFSVFAAHTAGNSSGEAAPCATCPSGGSCPMS